MIEEFNERLAEKDPATVALLRQSLALPPAGFAARTVARFAAATARRQLRRLALLSAGLFVLSSATIWMLLLNIQNAAFTTWSGIKAALSLVGFIYTIWQRLPFTCGAVTIALLSVLLLTYGVLGKVSHSGVLVK